MNPNGIKKLEIPLELTLSAAGKECIFQNKAPFFVGCEARMDFFLVMESYKIVIPALSTK